MRRYSLPIVLILVILLPGISSGKESAGKFLAVKRKVQLLREGQRSDARISMPFQILDEIETGKRSRAKLLFRDDSVYNLGELSRLSVKKYLYDEGRERSSAVISLIKGMIKVGVGRSDLEIHTPTAVVAARGTTFLLWVEGEGEKAVTYLHVLEGEVSLRNIAEGIGGTIIIKRGRAAKVPSSKPPAKIMRPLQQQIMKVSKATIVPFLDRDRLRRAFFHIRVDNLPASKKIIRRYIRRRIREQPIQQEPSGAFTPVTINIQFPGMQ